MLMEFITKSYPHQQLFPSLLFLPKFLHSTAPARRYKYLYIIEKSRIYAPWLQNKGRTIYVLSTKVSFNCSCWGLLSTPLKHTLFFGRIALSVGPHLVPREEEGCDLSRLRRTIVPVRAVYARSQVCLQSYNPWRLLARNCNSCAERHILS